MAYGSGMIAAQEYGAAVVTDARACARGSLVETFARAPWIDKALPAMGYSEAQLNDLAATIAAAKCDTIIVATPVNLAHVIELPKPYCRVRYELEEITHPNLEEILDAFLNARAKSIR
jgi:predicted GTPase